MRAEKFVLLHGHDFYRYLYADEISLDEETVLATLNVAKKYMIPYLAKACVQFMEASLTARNACLLLSQSRIFDEPDLMERCWEVIDAQVGLYITCRRKMVDRPLMKKFAV